MKKIFHALLAITAFFGINHAFCNQYYENVEQDFLELNNTNERILIDNNQLKLFKNQLMVEIGENYLLPVGKLWQKEEGTFVTLSTDPDYRYQCMGCGATYEYQPLECHVCKGGDFIPKRREKR